MPTKPPLSPFAIPPPEPPGPDSIVLSARVPPALVLRLDRLAMLVGRSRSQVIVLLLEAAVAEALKVNSGGTAG